jgi:hypothetical protein
MEQFTGAIKIDPRPIEKQAQDFGHSEPLGAGVSFNWVEKKDWVKLSVRDQNGSGSCGAQSGSKAIEALTKIIASAVPIFRKRSNYPTSGMFQQEIGSILLKSGTTSETLCPSQVKNDIQMDATSFTDTPYKIDGYYFLPIKDKLDMDLLATALEKGHPLIIGHSTTYADYGEVPVPSINPTTIDHFVCAVPPNYLLYKGEKAVVIDDSALHTHTLPNAQRIFTETFIKKQVWGIMALIPHVDVPTEKPKYHFEKDLKFGMRSDDVVKLQDFLKFYGFFSKAIPSTGYFLQVTELAVKKFQTAYASEILTPVGLDHATGYVGKSTRQKINSMLL